MEITLTKNRALYFAHHTIGKERAALFRRFRVASRSQTLDGHRQLTNGNPSRGRTLDENSL
ncbi:MAG: hypothetical protein ABI925_11955 [Verrucomicrobiota bacterium]